MKIIIAALGYNRVIGVNGTMPWWVPEEYDMFLQYITDESVIFGRKTYGYFSKELPAKCVYVVTRQDLAYDNAITCSSLDDALNHASLFPQDIYIAGGASIYKEGLDVADKMYLSYIKGEYEGDTFFPEFDDSKWTIEKCVDYAKFEFVIYKKI